ncbi:dihydrolipoyl dehydrogenase [candidate division WOR-3 bacterium]|uniref:Dihydrolipoyl dehydrogenase n=1 Tax=candidate division WOR-3 bacterium TaxID=2052148 RepID=A0A937XDA4_UNCW3|nr:dihydrolipoyl dehydrogenase [candidate division WOR-3 bacterium]
MRSVDFLIIGAGPAGYVAAIRLAQLGRKVVLVERERVGGVCLNWGCIPVKSLLHAASAVRGAAEARRMGIVFGQPEVDFQALYGWKGRVVDRLVRGVEFLLRSNGIETVKGKARFINGQRVMVVQPDGSETEIGAESIIIATGSTSSVLPGFEPDGKYVVDSYGALNLTRLPGRVVIVGAGAIGLEFATAFRRLGASVSVLELMPQLLPGFDAEVSSALRKAMQSEGIDFHLGVKVTGLDREPGLAVRFLAGEAESTVETDLVMVAVGRRPLTAGLELEQAGVKLDERGFVTVDQKYRTSAARIHAIGDVKPGPMLAHRAMADGISLAESLGGGRPWRFRAVPSCVYTDPEVASVGISEAEAAGQNVKVKVSRVPISALGRSLTLGRSDGLCKMVVDAATDKVLGVQIAAPQADVLIAEATAAIELGLTSAELGRVVHAHPTMSELLFEAAEAIHSKAVHIVNR